MPLTIILRAAVGEAEDVVTHKEKNRVAQKRFRQRQKVTVRGSHACSLLVRPYRVLSEHQVVMPKSKHAHSLTQ